MDEQIYWETARIPLDEQINVRGVLAVRMRNAVEMSAQGPEIKGAKMMHGLEHPLSLRAFSSGHVQFW